MKGQPQKLSRGQRIVVWLFGTALFAVGVWLLVAVAGSLYGYWRTRGEVTAAAQLRSVELRTSSGGRGGLTTSTIVRYEYHFRGQSFTGSRVAIFKRSGDFYPQLSSAFRSNTPIIVFVDPQQPHFAVIDRAFAWWPFILAVPFALVFTAVGVFILMCQFRTTTPPNKSLQATPGSGGRSAARFAGSRDSAR